MKLRSLDDVIGFAWASFFRGVIFGIAISLLFWIKLL